MRTFTDNKGDQWLIDIHFLSIEKVRREVDVDLIKWATDTGEEVAKAASDPVTIIRVICSLCSEQMEEREIDETEFGHRLVGDAIENATKVLVGDLIDFFPKKQRDLLTRLQKMSEDSREKLLGSLKHKMDSGLLEKLLEQPLTEFEKQCTNAAELLDSENQEPEPTATSN